MMKLTKEEKKMIFDHKDMMSKCLRRVFKNISEDIFKEMESQFYYVICKKIHTYDETKGKFSTFFYNIANTIMKNYFYRDILNYKLVEDSKKMTPEQIKKKTQYDIEYREKYELWLEYNKQWLLEKEYWENQNTAPFPTPRPKKPKGGRFSTYSQNEHLEYDDENLDNYLSHKLMQEHEDENNIMIQISKINDIINNFDPIKKYFYLKVFKEDKNCKEVQRQIVQHLKSIAETTKEKINYKGHTFQTLKPDNPNDTIEEYFITTVKKTKNIEKTLKKLIPPGGGFLREKMIAKITRILAPHD